MAIIEKIKDKYPDHLIKERDLSKTNFPPLDEEQIDSFFTPDGSRSTLQHAAVELSDATIAELHEADIIVIDTSMYNFSISSLLKAWIDHIARAGKTFSYSERGPEGLVEK